MLMDTQVRPYGWQEGSVAGFAGLLLTVHQAIRLIDQLADGTGRFRIAACNPHAEV